MATPEPASPQPELDLATFDGRWTMRYVRLLPAPIHRVWEALTVSEQINIWFLPVARVEPKLGGRCSFSFGDRAVPPEEDWTVSVFEPHRCVEYRRGEYSMRFELEAIDTKTRLAFIETVHPGLREELEAKGLRYVPNTPWCPGTTMGWHGMMDGICRFVADDWTAETLRAQSDELVALANARELNGLHVYDKPSPEEAERLYRAYYVHIRDHCPAE